MTTSGAVPPFDRTVHRSPEVDIPNTAWQWLLALLGMASILFGVLALLGRRPLGDPTTATVIALGAVLNGAVVTQLPFGRDRTP